MDHCVHHSVVVVCVRLGFLSFALPARRQLSVLLRLQSNNWLVFVPGVEGGSISTSSDFPAGSSISRLDLPPPSPLGVLPGSGRGREITTSQFATDCQQGIFRGGAGMKGGNFRRGA
ncbi:hypothetical protein FQA47_006237 [Oryzias melastigma]|uniref:Uncharacterized protein n=1 Tax=Oryzias melastigma TaxID=30732 RepID=A0A834KYW7_ORYME|nr:hypothetical protein FQA47_006237 [Oryzias melastigma]